MVFSIVPQVMTIENQMATNALPVLLTYSTLGILYLIVVPLFLYFWMHNRWHIMGKKERLSVYGLVFLFFPGLILFAPFLNLRLNGQGER